MNDTTNLRGAAALVTGASSGIGAATAERLAAAGAAVILVARDQARLEAVATGIRSRHDVPVQTWAVDLAAPDGPSRVAALLAESATELDVLVNNAGVAVSGPVAQADPGRLRALVDLNAGALVELTALLVPGMVRRGRGTVVMVASTGAYAPAPYLATYAASKAFVLSFSRALWAELRGTGVRVVAVSPGPTETGMNTRPQPGMRQPADVAETVVRALGGRRTVVVDRFANWAQTVLLGRVLHPRQATVLAARVMRRRMGAST